MSTNDPACPERRGFLLGLASLPLIGGGCAAAAGSADPVIDIARRAAEAEDAWAAADEAEDRIAGEVYRRDPPPPEALFEKPLDFSVGLLGCGSRHESGRRWYGDDETLEGLRQPQVSSYWTGADQAPLAYRPDPAKQARADEIVAAHVAWVQRKNEIADELGLEAANARSTELFGAYREVLGELVRTPATSLAGIIAKARFCGHMFDGGPEEAFADNESLTTFERVTHSAVRDLLALQGRA